VKAHQVLNLRHPLAQIIQVAFYFFAVSIQRLAGLVQRLKFEQVRSFLDSD